MKKIFLCLVLTVVCLGSNFCFAYTEDDLMEALNKTYKVNGEDFKIPAAIKNKAVNYINANYITEEQCNELMEIVNEGIEFANEVGTTDISKLNADQLKRGIAIVNKATNVLNVEVKINSTLDKVVATEKETGKIVEEVEKKDIFFKATGKERNIGFWCAMAFLGLFVFIVTYILLVKFIKFEYIDFICNTLMLLYIFGAMPFICFGSYIEIFDLLKPVLASEHGEGHIDIVEVEIKEPSAEQVVTEENKQQLTQEY